MPVRSRQEELRTAALRSGGQAAFARSARRAYEERAPI